jgi:hypothetical protein
MKSLVVTSIFLFTMLFFSGCKQNNAISGVEKGQYPKEIQYAN